MQKIAECQNSIPAKDVIVGKFQVEDDKENRKVRPTTNGDEPNVEVPGESRESPRTAERSHRGVTFDLSVNQQEETKHRKDEPGGYHGDYRTVFREEMYRLHRELETFRAEVNREFQKDVQRVEEKKPALQEELKALENQWEASRKELEENHTLETLTQEKLLIKQKQDMVNLELVLLEREEKLALRQGDLEDYEKQIVEIEGYLDRRMDIAKRREADMMVLDEELKGLHQDLSTTQEDDDGGAEDRKMALLGSSNIAWEMEKTRMQERNQHLELALKKSKADFARMENINEDLQNKVRSLELTSQQAGEQVGELQAKLSTAMADLVASRRARVPSILPRVAVANGVLANGDGSINSVSDRAHAHAHRPGMVAIRVNVKSGRTNEKPSTPISLHSWSPSIAESADAAVDQTEKPALAWRQHTVARHSVRKGTLVLPNQKRAPLPLSDGRREHVPPSLSGSRAVHSKTCSIQ